MQQAESKPLKQSNLSSALGNIFSLHHHPVVLIVGLSLYLPLGNVYAEAQNNHLNTVAVDQTATLQQEDKKLNNSVANSKGEQNNQLGDQAPIAAIPTIEMSEEEQKIIQKAEQAFAQAAEYDLNNLDVENAEIIEQQTAADLAQQAQQAAQQTENNVSTIMDVTQFITQADEFSESELRSQQQKQETEVSALLKDLQTTPVVLPDIQAVNSRAYQNGVITPQDDVLKRTWLDRLLRRDPVIEEQYAPKLPKINVVVCGANTALEANIKAKLSGFTVEAFKDFDRNTLQNETQSNTSNQDDENQRLLDFKVGALAKEMLAETQCSQNPQIVNHHRGPAFSQISTMTEQAAQAVGYYEAKFNYQKLDDELLMIWVQPNQPVVVDSQSIKIVESNEQGEEQDAKSASFRVIRNVPDLRKGDVLNHAAYETTKTRISSAASDLGYFDGHWRAHDVVVNLPESTADINLKYDTKQRYKLKAVEFRMTDESQPLPLDIAVLKNLVPFDEGDNYGGWHINNLTSNLTNSRYFNYALVNVAKPDPALAHLEPLAGINQPNTDTINPDQTTTSEKTPTTIALPEDLAQLQIANSEVEISAEQQAAVDEMTRLKQQAYESKEIPVIVLLNTDKRNNLEAGIGYGTDTGVRLRTQYRRAIVNRHGHSFDANLELSGIRQSLDTRYMIPVTGKNPLEDYFNLVGGYERETRDQIGQGVELGIESAVLGAERVIKRRLGEWQHNFGVRYRLDRINSQGIIDQDDVPDAFKIVTDSPDQQSLLFGYEASKTIQNSRVNPTEGFRQFYRIEAGSESLLTETDLAIINAGWRFIYSLGDKADHQFVGRADTGYIVTDNFDKVPYNLRYFAGGDQSIRGFDYKSLSPKADQLLIGGQVLATGSLEYNYQFKEGWRAAVFADAGNAYDEKFSNETKYGAGLGIRWASPIGPIRIDVAAGVSEPSIPIRLHFFIGPAL